MNYIQNFDNDGYGPILGILEKELAPFIKISERSYRYFIEAISRKPFLIKNKNKLILHHLLSNAKNNSFSIRLLSTWGQPIEGYALLRIRLEQLIVSSYLVHEKPEKGVEAFDKFYPITEYNILKANDKNDNLKLALSFLFPENGNGYNKRMKDLQRQIKESYEIEGEKFKRKWTNLYINQLAEERDKLVDENDSISRIKLFDYYNTLYKISSSIVHSDVASISTTFIIENEQGILKPQELYIFTNIITLALFDITQCYEIAKYLELDIDDKYIKLNNDYIFQVKKNFT